jgi:hypothetical protein
MGSLVTDFDSFMVMILSWLLAAVYKFSIAGGIAGTGDYVLFLYHYLAFFSAFVTGFSTLLTMLHFVFGAFITARLTNLGAERAEFSGER